MSLYDDELHFEASLYTEIHVYYVDAWPLKEWCRENLKQSDWFTKYGTPGYNHIPFLFLNEADALAVKIKYPYPYQSMRR